LSGWTSAAIDVGAFSHDVSQCPSLGEIKRGESEISPEEVFALLEEADVLPPQFASPQTFLPHYTRVMSSMLSVQVRQSVDNLMTAAFDLGSLASMAADTQLSFTIDFDTSSVSQIQSWMQQQRESTSSGQSRRLLSSASDGQLACDESGIVVQPRVFQFDEAANAWSRSSCETSVQAGGQALSAQCDETGRFAVFVVAEPAVGTCAQDSLFYAGAAFIVPAVSGFTQATRLLMKNGKCKMSFVLVAHLLVAAVSLVLGTVHLLSDWQSLSTFITVTHMFGFTCLGMVLSATVFMWGSVHQLLLRKSGSHSRSLKLWNGGSIVGFAVAVTIVSISGDDMLIVVGVRFFIMYLFLKQLYIAWTLFFIQLRRQRLHVSLPFPWQLYASCLCQDQRSVCCAWRLLLLF
jgi:hypothetical protein